MNRQLLSMLVIVDVSGRSFPYCDQQPAIDSHAVDVANRMTKWPDLDDSRRGMSKSALNLPASKTDHDRSDATESRSVLYQIWPTEKNTSLFVSEEQMNALEAFLDEPAQPHPRLARLFEEQSILEK